MADSQATNLEPMDTQAGNTERLVEGKAAVPVEVIWAREPDDDVAAVESRDPKDVADAMSSSMVVSSDEDEVSELRFSVMQLAMLELVESSQH